MIGWWRRRRWQRAEEARSRVLGAILVDFHRRHYAADLGRELGIRPGYLYPALHSLLEAGLIADGWEDQAAGPYPRRYYQAPLPGGQGQS